MSGAIPMPPTAPVTATTEATPVEAAPIAAPVATEPSHEQQAQAARFAALAKREKAAYRRLQEAKLLEQSVSQQSAKAQEYEQALARARQNPFELLNKAGLTYEDIVNFQLNGGKPTPDLEIKDVRNEFENYKKQQEELRTKQVEQERLRLQQEQEEVVQNWKAEVNDFLTTNSDDYELINRTNYGDMVTQTIEEHWKRSVSDWEKSARRGPSPKIMSNKEAADLVERFLEETIEETVSKSKKFSGRYRRIEEQQAQAQSSRAPEPSFTSSARPTLNNNIPTSTAPSMLSPRNEQERIARALAKLGG